MTALLELDGLVKRFPVRDALGRRAGAVHAVDGVSLSVAQGEVLAIVGESGCGKSTLGRLMLNLITPDAGSVRFGGEDLTKLSPAALRAKRRDMQLIFQDPFASLDPRMTVEQAVAEPLRLHRIVPRDQERARVADLLSRVGLRPELARRWPHEFSGGQRQRIAIARALASEPKLIVGDEPVSALDVSVQAQVVNLLSDLIRDLGLTFVLISHDLGVVRHVADRVAVMYLGRIVEEGPAEEVLSSRSTPTPRAARRRAGPWREGAADRGRRAIAHRAPARLPLPHALPLRRGRLPRDAACALRTAAPRRVPPRWPPAGRCTAGGTPRWWRKAASPAILLPGPSPQPGVPQ